MIEQKGMTKNHDFGYSFPLFSYLLEKEGRSKENQRMNSKSRDFKSCLSARSTRMYRIKCMYNVAFREKSKPFQRLHGFLRKENLFFNNL